MASGALAQFRDLARTATEMAAGADPSAPIPTCPGWHATDLSNHLAMVYQLMAYRVRENANPHRGDLVATAPKGTAPSSWLQLNFEKLYDLLTSRQPSDPAWNWTGKDQTVGWIIRRITHEVAIHLIDYSLANPGHPSPAALGINPELATDGLAELFDGFLPNRASGKGDGKTRTLRVHATDRPVEWILTFSPAAFSAKQGAGDAEAAIAGSVVDLYLMCWNRPAGSIDTTGSEEVVDEFRALPR